MLSFPITVTTQLLTITVTYIGSCLMQRSAQMDWPFLKAGLLLYRIHQFFFLKSLTEVDLS